MSWKTWAVVGLMAVALMVSLLAGVTESSAVGDGTISPLSITWCRNCL